MDNENFETNTEENFGQVSPTITKEELRSKPDTYLLDLVKRAVAEHHTGKDFSQAYGVDCSYKFIRDELRARGWADDWHRAIPADEQATTIELKAFTDTIRRTYTLSRDTAEKWSAFIAAKPYTAVLTDEALKRFMADYENHAIDLIFKL